MDFTTRSREALGSAQQAAVSAGNPQLEPVHLLGALVAEAEGIPAALLQALGVDRGELAAKAVAAIDRLPQVSGPTASGPQASGAFQRVLARAQERAQERGDAYVSTEHLLLGLASVPSEASDLLAGAGATEPALSDALER